MTPKPGVDNTNIADLAKPLLGKELTMRYAERTVSPSSMGAADAAAYSVISRQQALKIVGITDLDPDSMRGAARARALPAAQAGAGSARHAANRDARHFIRRHTHLHFAQRAVKAPSQVPEVESAVKNMGFNAFSIVDANESTAASLYRTRPVPPESSAASRSQLPPSAS